MGYLYNNLGFLHNVADKSEAITYLNKAQGYITEKELLSISYSNKAQYYFKQNNVVETFSNIQKGIDVLTVFNPRTLSDNPSIEKIKNSKYKTELLGALIEKAKYCIKFKDTNQAESYLDIALSTLMLADKLADNIRYESSGNKSKLFWRETASSIYTNAVKTCYLLNDNENAFYFFEKNKALLLLEDVTSKQLKEKANIPEEVINKQNSFKITISGLQDNILNSDNTVKNDSLAQLLLNTKDEYASFFKALKTTYPDYYKAQIPPEISTLNNVQNDLKNSNIIYISYILNDEIGYGLLVSKNSEQFFELKNVDNLFSLAQNYRRLLEIPFSNQKDINLYNKTSLEIYNTLIPKSISEKISNKKIIIIPDYYLQNLPFEALITSENEKKYFIQNNDISYAYSATFLNQNKSIERDNENEFLGIAPIRFNGDLIELTKSKTEIESISELFESQLFTEGIATSKNFIDNSNNNSIIHFATHANANDSISPWIAFSDKKMSLNELYLTSNSADLIVLSACKTSLGEISQGEGVMSLARGFFNSGANSVVSTLWNVNDKSSGELLTEFYNEIKSGKTKSEALRLAKLNYINSKQLSEQSPHYWASFILIGDAESIPSFHNYNILISISIILIISMFLFFIKRKLKK